MMIWCFMAQSILLRLAYKNHDDLVFYGPDNTVKVIAYKNYDDLVSSWIKVRYASQQYFSHDKFEHRLCNNWFIT